ncbi:MAG: hypothetical protein IV100_33125 [Myxococcales bacterium]|nr:hypothetical protein [Myxococcales bacterium]
MNRRQFLWGTAGATLSATLFGAMRGGRLEAQTGTSPGVFWVQVHANGGWDQMLFCDPKFGPRQDQNGAFHSLDQLAQVAGIPYVDAYSPAAPDVRPVATFFEEFGARLLVLNGLDTTTNNHDVGTRYCMSGSLLEGFPIFAAQVAGVLGQGQVMPLVDVSGYDEAGGLVAPVRLDYVGVPRISALKDTNKPSAGQWLNNSPTVTATSLVHGDALASIRAARAARLQRHQDAAMLPTRVRALEAWRKAVTAAPGLADLEIPQVGSNGLENTKALASMGVKAFKGGHATAMTVSAGGPNLDSHGIADYDHLAELAIVMEVARHVADEADAHEVPCIVVMSSDFGRTPVREAAGSGHWPVASMMLLQNSRAAAMELLPRGLVIGGTTGLAEGPNSLSTVLNARKVHPTTHQFDDGGITLTPAHVFKALRRVAGIAEADALRPFAIHLDGAELDLGAA